MISLSSTFASILERISYNELRQEENCGGKLSFPGAAYDNPTGLPIIAAYVTEKVLIFLG
jgi:hypothetical protein